MPGWCAQTKLLASSDTEVLLWGQVWVYAAKQAMHQNRVLSRRREFSCSTFYHKRGTKRSLRLPLRELSDFEFWFQAYLCGLFLVLLIYLVCCWLIDRLVSCGLTVVAFVCMRVSECIVSAHSVSEVDWKLPKASLLLMLQLWLFHV